MGSVEVMRRIRVSTIGVWAILGVVVAACGVNAGEAPVTPASEAPSIEYSQQLPPASGATAGPDESTETTTVIGPDESKQVSEEEKTDSKDLTPVAGAVTQSPEASSLETRGPIEPGLQPLVAEAADDLAARLSVSLDDIVVMQAESVVWPDGSLGCPQPGMAYTQTLVDGFRILLQADGATYSYHGGGASPEPFLCENPKTP